MAVDIRDFHTAAQALTEKQRQIDLDDLGNEMAGRETGRNSRFRNKEDSNSEAAQRRRANTQAHMTALETMLLNDPEYAKIYNDTMDLLAEAEQVVEGALAQAEQALKQSSEELQTMLDNASQLPDGRKVFRDEEGQVWTADNERVSPEEAESIVWKDGSPSHTDFQKQKQLHQDRQQRYDDLYDSRYNVLGDIRNRMEDQDNPVAKEDVKGIQDTIEEQMKLSKADSVNELQQGNAETTIERTANNFSIPDLGSPAS